LVSKLAANALVVTSDNNSDNDTKPKTVELVSDSLIHHWQLLQDWINDKRDFRTWQNRLRVDLEKWDKADAKD
jgi:hypothetical protein